MLIACDASQLEWRVKVWLAQDPVGMKEIQEGYPIHDDNQKVFGLPTRTIAKIFIYRCIFADSFGERGFAGPAFAYANDSDFRGTSTSAKYWEKVIERFYDKYKGVYDHSVGLIREAIESGRVNSPSGRFYQYKLESKYGRSDWPRTQILNHIVQGLSADFVMIARLLFWKRLKQMNYGNKVLPCNTVHDSIEVDCDSSLDRNPEICYNIALLLEQCFRDIPAYFEKHYGTVVNVPMAAECKFGFSLYEPDMCKFDPQTYEKDLEKICNSN